MFLRLRMRRRAAPVSECPCGAIEMVPEDV
jgi:hypothetical protein